jgi:hypothetical protein
MAKNSEKLGEFFELFDRLVVTIDLYQWIDGHRSEKAFMIDF